MMRPIPWVLHEMELREREKRSRLQALLEGVAFVAGLFIIGYIWFCYATYGDLP